MYDSNNKCFAFVFFSAATVHGIKFIQSGKQYTFEIEARVGAGTGDYVPSLAAAVLRSNMIIQNPGGGVLNVRV